MFPYKSKGYSILYYGTSRRGMFRTSEIKNCLNGIFPHKTRNTDFLEPAGRLVKAGLLERINNDSWRITDAGVKAMISAAAYYREFRIRTTSIRYIEDASERIRKIHATNMTVMEKLDAEDKILEEIEHTITTRNNKKNKQQKS